MSRLDELLEQAGEAEPGELHPVMVERAVRHAALAGRARHRGHVVRRITVVAGISAALAAAAATVLMLGGGDDRAPAGDPVATTAAPEPAPEAPAPTSRDATPRDSTPRDATPHLTVARTPTELTLVTGDRLLAAEGARFVTLRTTARERTIQLAEGNMLFDVRPLEGGRFVVRTEDAEITVLGTVFTVAVHHGRTVVRVYEGRVRVERRGASPDETEESVLEAGSARAVSAPESEGGGVALDPDPLAEPANEAARRRAAGPDEPTAVEAESPIAARSASARAASSAPTEAAPEVIGPDQARRMIASGDRSQAMRALELAEARVSRGERDPWLMLRADAIRVVRPTDAPAAYARAAEALRSPAREQAGFTGAYLLAPRDPAGALAILETGRVASEGSPLRERGLALRIDLLTRLGRAAELTEASHEYLRLYPDTSRAAGLRERLGEPTP
ncbi:MAG: FecR domain-containing protein [Sandaracinaceae bacterium]